MKDFDDETRRLADTLTGHPHTADAAADPIHGIAPRTGEPAGSAPGAGMRADGALGRPVAPLSETPEETRAAEEDARHAMAHDPAYAADDEARGEMTAPEARHAAAIPGGRAAPDPEAERIEALRAARGEAGPGLSRAEARARLMTTALPFGWKGMLGFGILTALGGAAAILMPFVGTLATVGFAAAMFVLLGAGTLFMAIRGDERVVPHRVMNGALGALMIAFGVLAFFQPLGAILSLTILAASFFVAEGAMRLWLGFKARGEREGWGWLALGGAFSLALGVMLFLGLPGTALWALGLLLGIDLLTTGIAMIALSFAEKRATGGVDEASPA